MKSVVASGVAGPGASVRRSANQAFWRRLKGLIEDAIRGDPEVPLRWVSRSQRNIAEALRRQGFQVSQKLVGRLLREQQSSNSIAVRLTASPARDPTTPTEMPSSSTSTPP